jgi:hypothetical protein
MIFKIPRERFYTGVPPKNLGLISLLLWTDFCEIEQIDNNLKGEELIFRYSSLKNAILTPFICE